MQTVALTKDVDEKPRKGAFNYRLVSGMTKFIAQSTHPEIAHAVIQCARNYEYPKLSYDMSLQLA